MGISYAGLTEQVGQQLEELQDTKRRQASVAIRLADAMKSAYCVFALKFQSLLQFEKERKKGQQGKLTNLEKMFQLEQVPSDTQMREIVDEIEPQQIRPIYQSLFATLQRGKHLNPFHFMKTEQGDPLFLISLDGTGYFSSTEIYCKNCLVKESRKDGRLDQHQMVSGCVVHPELSQVIPLAPEPISNEDGASKNDGEWNATRRFIHHLKKEHPHLKAVITADALAGRQAMVNFLNHHGYHYILAVKPGNNKGLFRYIDQADQSGHVRHFQWQEQIGKKIPKQVTHHVRCKENVDLSNKEVNTKGIHFVEYWETTEWTDRHGKAKKTQKHFSWITDLKIKGSKQVQRIVQGGRARWKIENETFNTLKNQGYQFEHNLGHGHNHLSNVFAQLMMLAFFVDQASALG